MYDETLKNKGSIRKAAYALKLSKSQFVKAWKLELGLCQRKTGCKNKPEKGKTGCRECLNYASSTIDKDNKSKYNKKYYRNNKEEIKVYFKEYQKQNLDKFREASKRYRATDKGKISNRNKRANRRAAKLERTVKWANLDKIKEIYTNCPKGHHIDHILPLQGEFISGLHVEHNLQYLSAFENDSKGDKFDFTYTNEGWRKDLKKT